MISIDRFDWNTHTTKMHLLFGNPTLRNSKVKRAWLGEILGWVTPWEVFQGARE